MLARRLELGPPRPDEFFVFANTGKEREETLVFVHEMETRWNVPIVWLERERHIEHQASRGITWKRPARWSEARAVVVDFTTAARKGEPFAALIREREYLPNIVTRFCTVELKIRTIGRYMRSVGVSDRLQAIGLRADEPDRVTNLLATNREQGEEAIVPLYDASVTVGHVMEFWRRQPFDLQLAPHEGNCDLCFLKGQAKLMRVIREHPELVDWWREREREPRASNAAGGKFRKDRPSYDRLHQIATTTPLLPGFDDDVDLTSCACTD